MSELPPYIPAAEPASISTKITEEAGEELEQQQKKAPTPDAAKIISIIESQGLELTPALINTVKTPTTFVCNTCLNYLVRVPVELALKRKIEERMFANIICPVCTLIKLGTMAARRNVRVTTMAGLSLHIGMDPQDIKILNPELCTENWHMNAPERNERLLFICLTCGSQTQGTAEMLDIYDTTGQEEEHTQQKRTIRPMCCWKEHVEHVEKKTQPGEPEDIPQKKRTRGRPPKIIL